MAQGRVASPIRLQFQDDSLELTKIRAIADIFFFNSTFDKIK